MKYECQSCYSSFDENEVGENSLGDKQCPECGGFDLVETDPEEMFKEDQDEDRDDVGEILEDDLLFDREE